MGRVGPDWDKVNSSATQLVKKIRNHPRYWTYPECAEGWKVLWEYYGRRSSRYFNLQAFEEIICLADQALGEE